MDLKLGLKIGHIELQFEGSSATFEAKFESVFNDLVEFGKDRFEAGQAAAPAMSVGSSANQPAPSMTVRAVAAKLGGETSGELLYATVASLAVIKSKQTMTRQEINDEMKLATGYYKASYTSNLTRQLDALV